MKFPKYQIVIGQYLGIGLLIAISIIASFVSLVIPSFVIGLMGIIPMIIGIKKLIEYHNNKKTEQQNTNSTSSYRQSLSFLSVAAITFSNGGDNIGIYTPLFASNNAISQIIIIIVIFMIMTAFWCSIGYYLVNHSFLANNIRLIGHLVLPFVLIGLGIYIMVGEFIK